MILQDWFNLSSQEAIQCQARLFQVENEFFQQSLRNVALVGTSKIDFLLADILGAFLERPHPDEREVVERFSFEVKIRLCRRLGLIDMRMARALDFLRRTRNTFAHQPTASEPEVRQLDRIHDSLRDEYMYMVLSAAYARNEHLRNEAERNFVTLLMYVIMLLNYYVERLERVSNKTPTLQLKSKLPTCTIKSGKEIDLIEPINLPT